MPLHINKWFLVIWFETVFSDEIVLDSRNAEKLWLGNAKMRLKFEILYEHHQILTALTHVTFIV